MLGVHCTEWYMFTLISKKYVYINPMTFCIPVYGCRHDLFRQMSAVKYDVCFTFQLSVFFIVCYSSKTFPSYIYIYIYLYSSDTVHESKSDPEILSLSLSLSLSHIYIYIYAWVNSKLMCLKLLDKLLDILRDMRKFYIFISK